MNNQQKINVNNSSPKSILILFLIFNFLNLSSQIKIIKLNKQTEIIIEIKEKGPQKILSEYFELPSQVYINEIKQDSINNIYNFLGENNIIKIIWDNPLTIGNSMFKSCTKITKIEFIKIDTSTFKNIDGMFYECYSLTSLDLSIFDTSSITTMAALFQDCKSLKILNINHFDTTNVKNMDALFYNCNSLIFLDLRSFDTTNVTQNRNIFEKCNSNLIYCFNDNKLSYNIQDELKKINNGVGNNCSNSCFNNNTKIIIEENICVNNCSNNGYKYEYNNICYNNCPNGTYALSNGLCIKNIKCNNYSNYEYTQCFDYIPDGYYLNDSSLNIIDKCNIKCKNCTSESNKNNLCISCNKTGGYYPKYDELNNIDAFIDCYQNEIDNYYFDNITKEYKKCYKSCKNCYTEGNNNNHNCKVCLSNYILNISNCYQNCSFYSYFDSENEYHCTDNNNCTEDYNKLIIDKKKCVNNCLNNGYKFEYNNICYNSCPNGTYYIYNQTGCINNIPQLFKEFILENN